MGLGKGVVGCNSRGTFEIRIRPTVMNPSNKVKLLHYRSWANSQPIDDPEPALAPPPIQSPIRLRVRNLDESCAQGDRTVQIHAVCHSEEGKPVSRTLGQMTWTTLVRLGPSVTDLGDRAH